MSVPQLARLWKVRKDTLPSWIASEDQIVYGWVEGGGERADDEMVRKNPDSLARLPGNRGYSTSGTRGPTNTLEFTSGVIDDPDQPEIHVTPYHSAFLEGFLLGTIRQLSC